MKWRTQTNGLQQKEEISIQPVKNEEIRMQKKKKKKKKRKNEKEKEEKIRNQWANFK